MGSARQVLRFYAFFQESVTERPDENSRKRHIILMTLGIVIVDFRRASDVAQVLSRGWLDQHV